MTKPDLILIGAGGHAHACIDAIEQQGEYEIAGLVGTKQEINDEHFGYSVFASDDDLPKLAKEFGFALVAVGQIDSPDKRVSIYQHAVQLGFALPTIAAPTAHVSRHAVVGAGTIVMHGAIVNAGSSVGENCIINSRALIEHDAVVEDHCHISTGAILNGNARVGAGSFIGSGSVVRDGISIGKNCLVGMGLFVRHNQTDNTRFLRQEQS